MRLFLVFAAFLHSGHRSSGRQIEESPECLCGADEVCDLVVIASEITNLEELKQLDLVLCATDACPEGCEAIWANRTRERVSTVQEAVTKILARAAALNRPINVLVNGHGSSGLQCFGGDECIGINPPYNLNKVKFIDALNGKLDKLYLLGCSAADDPKGQSFLAELSKGLGGILVKGFTGTNTAVSFLNIVGPACTRTPGSCRGTCPEGQICHATDLQCGVPIAGMGRNMTEGVKKELTANGANKALIIANSDYLPPINDLPNDVIDMIRKHNAVDNAGWVVMNMQDLTATEMTAAIAANKPQQGQYYFVWYSGHGSTNPATPGSLVGVDGNLVSAAAFAAAVGQANHGRTFVKLDSCGSGAFADAVNAIAPAIGFQTAVTGLACAPAGAPGAGSPFTACYVSGLNGLADTSGDGKVTVAEAAAYASANCVVVPGSPPQWDGQYDGVVLGATKTGGIVCCLPNGFCIDNVSPEVCAEKGGMAAIPTVSEWGLVVMTLLLATSAKLFLRANAPVAPRA